MAITPTIEPELLRAVKRGDLEAFETMVSRYEKPILNYLYRLLGKKEDAEDVLQEVFLKVYTHHRKIDPEKDFNAWVYRIATTTAYDFLRRAKPGQELFIIDDAENPLETIDEHDAYYSIETSNDLEQGLSKIKPIYKSVLLLHFGEGFSYEEVAEMVGAPLNTVKTYLHRGKRALKDALLNSPHAV